MTDASDASVAQRRRGVKIVCTLGPRSSSREAIRGLVAAGMDVARLNFSHGSHDEHAERVRLVREAAAEAGRSVAILQDLRGPKVRVGAMAPGAELVRDAGFELRLGAEIGDAGGATVDDAVFFEEVRAGDRLLLADGTIVLEVESVEAGRARCRVVAGGILASGKGVNVPRGLLRRPILGAKDLDDLAFGARLGIDLVGVSYVRTANDLRLVRQAQRPLGPPAPLVAKIETAAAIANLAEVLEETNAVMLARGDLALETPFERVPMEQKRILAAARRRGRPVVIATQMLVSMVQEPQPTRAEVNDVANGVLDGADAVMLSEETAVGVDPAHVVRTMDRIVRYTESCRTPEILGPDGLPEPLHALAVAAEGAARMARQVEARAIVAWSQSGLAARLLSRAGPGLPIVAPTPRLATARLLALVRDVTPVLAEGHHAPEDRVRHGFGAVGAEEGWIVVFGHERGEEGRRLPWTRMARLEEPASWLGVVGARE